MTDIQAELRKLLLEQGESLSLICVELAALRREVAELKSGKIRAKPKSVSAPTTTKSLDSREISKMMFISWASRQPLSHDAETAEARQRRLLPVFESSNNSRVLNVDHLR